MFNFKDQVVAVTGAAGNLGRATARAFLEAGAHLVLVDRNLEHLEQAFPDLNEDGSHVFAAIDLLNPEAVEGMIFETVQQLGRIDVLVNIVGGFRMGPPLHETPLGTWDLMMNLNAKTILVTARAVVPHMLQQGSGKIVNIAARPGLEGRPRSAAYGASKAAVMRLTESMSAELKSDGINVNGIIPGTIDTAQNREAMPKADHSKWVPPEAIADAILFLASDAARAVHGAFLPVYGLT